VALNEWLVTPGEWRERAEALASEMQRLRAVVQRGALPEPWAAKLAPEVLELADSYRAWLNETTSDLLSSAFATYSSDLRGWSKRFDALVVNVMRARSAANLPPVTFATNMVPDAGPLVTVPGHPVLWMMVGAGLLYILNEHTKGK
jgi:hypothetical protein